MDFKKLPPVEEIEKEEHVKEFNIQTDDIFKELFEPENILDIGRQEVDKQHFETFIQGLNELTNDDEIQLY